MRNVLITISISKDRIDELKSRYPQFEFTASEDPSDELVASAEIIMGGIDADILSKSARLKWFHSASAGVDHFIDDVDRLHGDLLVTNSAGIYGVPISEHLLAMMLSFSHRINLSVRNMKEEKWGGLPHCAELSALTVGIVGLGDIGRHLAALLTPFGCEVLAFKRTEVDKPAGVSEMLCGMAGLDELMKRSDHICVCLPGSPGTKGIIDDRRIGLMKSSAFLYNIGRGYLIDTDALTAALKSGAIAGAGLDVTDPEPLPPGHPLWQLENVIITPHISGSTPPHWQRRALEFFEKNLNEYIAGKPLSGLVDRINKY